MSTRVLATKLFAPLRRPDLVARPRIVEQLDATVEAHHRLTLVSAPAGFGKTTALGDWLARLDRRHPGIRVAWLSLDEDDNDPTRFLTHLVAAFAGMGLDVGPEALDSPGVGVPDALTVLVNDVARAADEAPGTQWVQVLDDYHVIGSSEVHEAVTFLLAHGPAQLHLMLATRSDPPLPLARLRSRGQLTEVRAADLRLTRSEAGDFLHHVMGLDLTTADVAALEERTEGWVAGLQLAGLSLKGTDERSEVAGFIDAFTGSNRFVIDYLADEVLARQPGEVRDFLLRTAVLDRLTGSLCDAVTGRSDAARTLEGLERDNLFVVPLDAQRSWYRYHHLFADVLEARLLAEHPDEVPDLHRRASAWYATHDLPIQAVRHAVAAEDFGRAAHLMEEALPDLRRARQDGLLLTWMQSLPEPVVRRSPVLSIWSAWSRLMTGDLDSMEAWLRAAEVALAAGAADPTLAREWADTEDLRTAPATISIYRASVAQARGDVAGTVHHAQQALDLAAPDDHLIRGQGGAFLGLAAWAAGDVAEALETFGAAVGSLHAAGNLVDELDTTIVLADLWVALGRPGRARELFEQGLQRATADGKPYPRAAADLHVGLAELDRELDELADARHHLETARVLARRASITENRHRWFVAMAEVRTAAGHRDEVGSLLDEAEALYRRGFYPEIRPIPAVRARLAIAAGDLASAAAWADSADVRVDDDPDYLREYEHLTLVRLLLAEHRRAPRGDPAGRRGTPVADALRLLDRLHVAAAEAGRVGSLIEISVLQAFAHDVRGDEPRALAALRQSWALAPEPDSQVRLYLDLGEPMLDLLRRAVTVREPPLPRRLAERLPGPAAPGTGDPRQHALADPLSQRELDVLRLLDSELTGPDIARRLFVSLNTLRTHTKRIFTKLDVNSRAAAVRRAHQLGLL
ncbi:LuxR C-terminal-related transcriptional regulator [Nocardioides euryhalodurans]|uniref:Helix-turn-helix transcriptional regulator n=1 Tax=Nocardioides euryhalodurans TaxID=2518370 RepID=A0A4P7GHF7_9ACTN|nr:LuxR C-terminal-related transcriptional regulator [Nocardioides euryhalodurans]QBR91266.1 helix-turn-helix transcriptional regulator [Nocardioides euryhalodurans]